MSSMAYRLLSLPCTKYVLRIRCMPLKCMRSVSFGPLSIVLFSYCTEVCKGNLLVFIGSRESYLRNEEEFMSRDFLLPSSFILYQQRAAARLNRSPIPINNLFRAPQWTTNTTTHPRQVKAPVRHTGHQGQKAEVFDNLLANLSKVKRGGRAEIAGKINVKPTQNNGSISG